MMTRKFGYAILNEMRALELAYMEQDYLPIKGHKRSQGTSRNLKVVVESHMMLFGNQNSENKFHVMRTGLFPHSFTIVDT